MSVTTKVACLGLMRDSAPELVSQANGLRMAENVVLRSPGVLETRPSYDMVTEVIGTDRRIKALREFRGNALALWLETDAWGLSNQTPTDYTLPADGLGIEPVDYDASEPRFVEARGNLYCTARRGVFVVESSDPADAPLRRAGVELSFSTDWHGSTLSYNDLFVGWDPGAPENLPPISDQVYSVAYRFVLVRKDSNGYIRRSAPSHEIVTTCLPARNAWGVGERFYFDRSGQIDLSVGDQVEFYRTLAVPQGSPRCSVALIAPRPDYYLSFAYSLTADDLINGYFVPPDDVTAEADLGAELYTNIGHAGAAAAKYPPPSAQAVALFQGCTWYGRTIVKQRSPTFQLRRIHYPGVASIVRYGAVTGTLLDLSGETPADSAAGISVGMAITDNYTDGPTVDGTLIPANTLITKIKTVGAFTELTLSNSCFGFSGTSGFYIMPASVPPRGLIAERTGSCTYASGSYIVTGVANSSRYAAGMYWTDNGAGPYSAGALVPAQTLIEGVGPGYVVLTNAATGSGVSDGYVGDTLTIGPITLYAWIEFYNGAGPSDVTDHTMIKPWNGYYPFCFPIHDARSGRMGVQSAIAAIVQWVNFYSPTIGFRAVPNGLLTTEDCTIPDAFSFSTTSTKNGQVIAGGSNAYPAEFNGWGDLPYAGFADGFSLEEIGIGGASIEVSSSCPTAWSPEMTASGSSPTEAETRPNRIYFSAVDEPEAVPLLNYIDVGAKDAPVLALVPLRNALLVFKSDGLWRITGYGPTGWSVDPLDPNMRLLRPESVTSSQNKAYAWCNDGFREVDENGAVSLSAEKLDQELRPFASYVTDADDTHGAFAVAIQQRNLVLFGVPDGQHATKCARIYAFNQTTRGFTEWPMEWGPVCESASLDLNYYSRPPESASGGLAAIEYEVRKTIANYDGRDRGYVLGPSTSIDGDVITVAATDIGTWRPIVGDWISATNTSLVTYFRRITQVSYAAGVWTITLEAEAPDGSGLMVTDAGVFFITDGAVFFLISDLSLWTAHESIVLAVEWHPTAPDGLPVGAICREMQFQLDLTQAPDPASQVSLPEYVVGASSERDTSPYTLTSNHPRTRTLQPLRVGVSRQAARSATIAPYFQTSDIYAVRLVGASLVHEGTSEKTRR